MKKKSYALLCACIVALTGVSSVNANTSLPLLVKDFINKSPEIEALKSSLKAEEAKLKGAALPLNNPELGVNLGRSDVNSYSFSITQTIDWNDKQPVLEDIALTQVNFVKAELTALILEKTTELLKSIGEIEILKEVTYLASERSKILKRFTELSQRRFNSGDIPKEALELARLSLIESIMNESEKEASLIQAKADFFSLNGYYLSSNVDIPNDLPANLPSQSDAEVMAKNHPKVTLALLQSTALKKNVQAVLLENKVDPTLGVEVGNEGSVGSIGLSLTLPLQIRNDYKSRVDVANANTIVAEKKAKQEYLQALSRIKAAEERYQLVLKTWNIWISQGLTSLQERSQLLERQWETGEMNSTDYLIQIQQTLNTQIAGVELKSQLWSSWIEWLSSSNKLTQWLLTLTQEKHS